MSQVVRKIFQKLLEQTDFAEAVFKRLPDIFFNGAICKAFRNGDEQARWMKKIIDNLPGGMNNIDNWKKIEHIIDLIENSNYHPTVLSRFASRVQDWSPHHFEAFKKITQSFESAGVGTLNFPNLVENYPLFLKKGLPSGNLDELEAQIKKMIEFGKLGTKIEVNGKQFGAGSLALGHAIDDEVANVLKHKGLLIDNLNEVIENNVKKKISFEVIDVIAPSKNSSKAFVSVAAGSFDYLITKFKVLINESQLEKFEKMIERLEKRGVWEGKDDFLSRATLYVQPGAAEPLRILLACQDSFGLWVQRSKLSVERLLDIVQEFPEGVARVVP